MWEKMAGEVEERIQRDVLMVSEPRGDPQNKGNTTTPEGEPSTEKLRDWRLKAAALDRVRKAMGIMQHMEDKADEIMGIRAEEESITTPDDDGSTHTWTNPDAAWTRSLRKRDPFDPKRVEEIISKIEIGPDLTADQRTTITDLLKEFADIFALSLSEVLTVNFAKHKLNIDPDIILPKKIHQRPVTGPQKEWYNKIITDMEEASIIQRVPAEFIKCLSSTNLAPKEAGKTGMTKAAVLRLCNEECIKYGLGPYWEQIPNEEPETEGESTLQAEEDPTSCPGPAKTTKWRVCHAFNAVNKATQVPHFPAGDLDAKTTARSREKMGEYHGSGGRLLCSGNA